MSEKDNIEYWSNQVHQGNAREKLSDLPAESVDMSYDRIDDETKRIFDDRSVFDY